MSDTRVDVNRRRITQAALAEFSRDPDVSMDQIAKAAGVVRRTVYGHFPSREALVSTLVDDAIESIGRALIEGSTGIAEPDAALVGAVFAVWPIADRYRLLISMAEYHVSIDGLAERLAPVRAVCEALIRNGKEAGLFTSPVPTEVLAYSHEHIMLGLLAAVDAGALPPENGARYAATTALLAVGAPPERIQEILESRDVPSP